MFHSIFHGLLDQGESNMSVAHPTFLFPFKQSDFDLDAAA